MPSCELWLWLLSLCVNMSEGRFWFVFGFKTSVGWHRLLVPANLELKDLFNSVITFLLRTMTSSPFSVWLVCFSSISSMSFSLISEILENVRILLIRSENQFRHHKFQKIPIKTSLAFCFFLFSHLKQSDWVKNPWKFRSCSFGIGCWIWYCL